MICAPKCIWSIVYQNRSGSDLRAKMHMVRVPKPIWAGIGTHFDLCAKMHMVHVPIGVRKSIWLEFALLSICASECKWLDLALDFTAQPSRRVPLHLLQQSWTSTTPHRATPLSVTRCCRQLHPTSSGPAGMLLCTSSSNRGRRGLPRFHDGPPFLGTSGK